MVILFLLIVIYPLAMLYVALVPKEWLADPGFKTRWGPLYKSIKTDTYGQRFHFFIFIFRRALLVVIGFTMYAYPGIQVQLILGANILAMIYQGLTMQFKKRFTNRLELNTEMFLATITYHLVTFTDFVPAAGGGMKARTTMGYSFITWVSLLTFINLCFVMVELYRKFRLKVN